MTNLEAFHASLDQAAPPADFDLALQGLWWAGRKDWDRAHGCVQRNEGEARCDWVHAHLHRVEGDLANAGYWYRRAGKPVENGPLDAEWKEIAAGLVG